MGFTAMANIGFLALFICAAGVSAAVCASWINLTTRGKPASHGSGVGNPDVADATDGPFITSIIHIAMPPQAASDMEREYE